MSPADAGSVEHPEPAAAASSGPAAPTSADEAERPRSDSHEQPALAADDSNNLDEPDATDRAEDRAAAVAASPPATADASTGPPARSASETKLLLEYMEKQMETKLHAHSALMAAQYEQQQHQFAELMRTVLAAKLV